MIIIFNKIIIGNMKVIWYWCLILSVETVGGPAFIDSLIHIKWQILISMGPLLGNMWTLGQYYPRSMMWSCWSMLWSCVGLESFGYLRSGDIRSSSKPWVMVSLCLEILGLSYRSLICPEIFGQGEFIPEIGQPRIEIGVSSEVGDRLEIKDIIMVPVDMVP